MRKFLMILLVLILMTSICCAEECQHSSQRREPDYDSYDPITSSIFEHIICDECGIMIDLEMVPSPAHENGVFRFTPNEFKERFDFLNSMMVDLLPDSTVNLRTKFITLNDGKICMYVLSPDGAYSAGVSFADHEGNFLTEADIDTASISTILIFELDDADTFTIVDIYIKAAYVCDALLTPVTAADTVTAALSTETPPYVSNDIDYMHSSLESGNGLFLISVMKNMK